MSRNFSLFPIRKLQRCPRYIPHDVAQSIRRLEVCRLHERVDVNDFKHTFLMGRANAVASFRDGPSVFGNHLILLSTSLSCDVSTWRSCFMGAFATPFFSPTTKKALCQFAFGERRR